MALTRAERGRRYAAKHADHLRAYTRKYQRENHAALVLYRQKYWQERRKAAITPIVSARRAWIDTFKQKPCADCGGMFAPCAMDFDHINGEKVSSVSQMMFAPADAVLLEIGKCELVCANCHRVRTFNRSRARAQVA